MINYTMLTNTNKLNISFMVIMTILVISFFYLLLFPAPDLPFSSQESVIFLEGRDFFADFFNVLRYMSDGSPYFCTINESDGHGALPLSYIIMFPFSKIVNYAGISLEDCWNNKIAMCSALMFLVYSVYLWGDSIRRLTIKYNVSQYNLIFFIFSSIFIFSVERGNQIIIAASLINYFIAYNDNPVRLKRIFALICICIATTLKGYPMLFGLPLLATKRYKDIAFCVVFTLFLIFTPFLLIDQGFANIPKIIENININNKAYIHNYNYLFGIHKMISFKYACTNASINFELIKNTITIVRIVETFLLLLTILLVLFEKRLWLQQLLIACAIIMFPINSGFYCGLYIFPILLLFFKKRKIHNTDYIFIILFCFILNPVQLVYKSELNQLTFYISPLISNIALAFTWVLAIFISLVQQISLTKLASVPKILIRHKFDVSIKQ